jgi:hypothetical protein
VSVGAPELSLDVEDSGIAYKNASVQNNLWSTLTDLEEKVCFGRIVEKPKCFRSVVFSPVLQDEVDYNMARCIEDELFKTFLKTSDSKSKPDFPFISTHKTKIGEKLHQDLVESWDLHNQIPSLALKERPKLKEFISKSQNYVEIRLVDIMYKLQTRTTQSSKKQVNFNMLSLVNRVPVLTLHLLFRSVFDDKIFPEINPFEAKCKESSLSFRKLAVLYLELCVLEDKLRRIEVLLEAGSDLKIIQEISNVRTWSTLEHPRWLVFEAEGLLQIRKQQYLMAKHLIENNGAISQLNMGLGKTRVILPMIVLYWIQSSERKLISALFINPLLREAYDHMHRFLTASVLLVPIFEQPFNRDNKLCPLSIKKMINSANLMVDQQGLLVIAPEHRLSLALKRLEYESNENFELVNLLDQLLLRQKGNDILDESDSLLSHKYQLIYAVGTPSSLFDGEHRWACAQSVLNVLNSFELDPNHFIWEELSFQYRNIRLLKSADGNSWDLIKRQVAEELFNNLPHDLRWLREVQNHYGDFFVDFVCDGTRSAKEILPDCGDGVKAYTQLLALRGLIGAGIIENCLTKRVRVNFGLSTTRKKKLAVPFRATDVPSPRSEFSHPDMAIVLTLIAYYQKGLSMEELVQAIKVLKSLGKKAQFHYYNLWLKSVEGKLGDLKKSLDSPEKLDVTNITLMNNIYPVFKLSMMTINFYLNSCVFPKDTAQYPTRLVHSAWHLVSGDVHNGFSGTNDTRDLLPLLVKQNEPEIDSITLLI